MRFILSIAIAVLPLVTLGQIPFSLQDRAFLQTTSPLRNSLAGCWRLEEATGTRYDFSKNGNHLTSNNSVGQSVGKVGNCGSFATASNTYLSVADNASISTGDIDMTVCAWVKLTTRATTQVIAAQYDTGANQRSWFLSYTITNQRFRFGVASDGGSVNTTNIEAVAIGTPDTNVWYFVAAWHDKTANTISIQVNNGAVNSTNWTLGMFDSTAAFTIGTQLSSGSPAGVMDGLIDEPAVWKRVLTADELTRLYKSGLGTHFPWSASTYTGTAKLYSYSAGSQADAFLDTTYVDSYSGITFNVNKPVKYSGNPVFDPGVNTATWDYDKNYNSTLKIGGTYSMWYACVSDDTPFQLHVALATSADGITWTKPNLGLISYDGNTANNILLGEGSFNPGVVYDAAAAADRKYASVNENRPGDTSGGAVYIYISPDGVNWSLIKTNDNALDYIEGKELVQKPDGKWLAYYTAEGLSDRRKIGAFLSDTTALDGAWTDQGIVIDTSLATAQKYSIGVEYLHGIYYGFVCDYSSTSERMHIDLYTSRNGTNWTLKSNEWLPLGSSGAWDDEMLSNGKSLIQEGNDWRFYYCGFAEDHGTPPIRDARVGLAAIGYERIGSIEGAGTITTTAFQPSAPLTVNADMTSGIIKIEVLNSGGSVISGYSRFDMDPISGDAYAATVTWLGNQIPTDQSVKIKFYLNAGS